MGLLYYISYGAIVATFGFVTLSLASGLLYISELIEEHSRLSKIWGQRGIYAIIALHVILYMTDSLPFLHTVFSICCHVVYLQNFSNEWPLISLSSLSFTASCTLVIVDHFLWFFYFSRITQEARVSRFRNPKTPGFAEIATFFGICVWMAPVFLFLSLSANDNALPTRSGEPSTPSSPSKQFFTPPTSLFRSILSVFSFKVPSIRPKIRRGTSEGLLAPNTDIPPPSPNRSSMTSGSVSSIYSSLTPPRSPRLANQRREDFARGSIPSQSAFKLGKPPTRTQSDGDGIGIRRPGSARDIDG